MSTDNNHFGITAKLDRIETFNAKSGKQIVTMILLDDSNEKWPAWVPVKVFGRSADTAKSIAPGSIVKVEGRLGGRDVNGRVWGDNVAERIDVVTAAEPPSAQQDGKPLDDDDMGNLPF